MRPRHSLGSATIAARVAGAAEVQAVGRGTPAKSGTRMGPDTPAVPLWMWPAVRFENGPLKVS